jgi:predicted ATPase
MAVAMLTKLTLKNFKGFHNAELKLGPLSLVIGANASGKSNLRDALRFIHGIARGYNLAEIIGEKYGEGGYREWSGLRGGAREVCRAGTNAFRLLLEFQPTRGGEPRPVKYPRLVKYKYWIEVEIAGTSAARVKAEGLYCNDQIIFDSHPDWDEPDQRDPQHIMLRLPKSERHKKMGPKIEALAHQPVLTQMTALARQQDVEWMVKEGVEHTMAELEAMRFVDFVPEAMRRPSLPGQIILSDQGENLSSVLQAICEDSQSKQSLLSWIQQLTPMDVVDLDFVSDTQGKILLQLIEKDGRKISAYSASDGTLRFLGVLAAFLGPKPARFYFLEEIDTGIHPARLFLLMNLLEIRSKNAGLQIFSTTHSPQMLRLLRDLSFASLTYRVEGVNETRIKSLPDIPKLMEVLKDSDIARLYEGGWMEQTMFFEEGEPEPFELDSEAVGKADEEGSK